MPARAVTAQHSLDCADPTVSAAFQAIVARKVDILEGGHLRLRNGALWPFAGHEVLFVRKVYASLFETVLRRMTTPRPFIVSGQPGIGKSMFGYVRCRWGCGGACIFRRS